MKVKLAIAALALLAGTVRADSLTNWNFSFATADQSYVGSGSFQTMSLADSIKAGVFESDGLLIVSLDGTMNGGQMTLTPASTPGLGSALDYPYLIFLDHALSFTVNGVAYFIHYNDTGAPPYGENLAVPQSGYQSIALKLTDPPLDTPEPSTLILLLCGISLIAAYRKSARRHLGI